jgi:hypothetical protein
MREFDRANQQKLSAAVRQFDMWAMVNYLTERYRMVAPDGEMARTIALILPEFAQVSSFTHGGACAGKNMRMAKAKDRVTAEIANKLAIALTMDGLSKENSLVVHDLDGSFLPLLREFQAARRTGLRGEEKGIDLDNAIFMQVIFDTNAYRRLTAGKTPAESLALVAESRSIEKMRNITAFASPGVWLEIFVHLADPTDPHFSD